MQLQTTTDPRQRRDMMPFETQRIPPTQPETAYLSTYVTFGMHAYRTKNEDCSVYYIDNTRGISRMVIDQNGQFCDFPITVTEDFWKAYLRDPGALKNQIRFRTSFEKMNGGFVVLWTVQPDGRYWADADGYGATSDVEITLYSFLDTNGVICAPFRIYRLGTESFYQPPFPVTPQEQPAAETILAEGVKKDSRIFKEIMWISAFLSNAVVLFILAFLSGEYDTYYGKHNPYGSIFAYMMNDILWIFLIILLVMNLILIPLAVLPHRQIQKSSVTLTNRRIFGVSTSGKAFNIALGEIISVRCSKTKLTIVSTSQKVTLRFLKNAKSIQHSITEFIKWNPTQQL